MPLRSNRKKKGNSLLRPQLSRIPNPQGFKNGEIHSWYNFVLGFSDQLVKQLMDHLLIEKGQVVLDPFCGTGTTLVESMKRGYPSIGIDASPFSCFVSKVKTSRQLEPQRLLSYLIRTAIEYKRDRRARTHLNDPVYKYLSKSGMIKRGWISTRPLIDALALKSAINRAVPLAPYRNALLLALVAKLSTEIGNMKFGPEIYRGPSKRNVDVWAIFEKSVGRMISDLNATSGQKFPVARVLKGDARSCSRVLRRHGIKKIHLAISSPPYPTEHDYTRNTRLELAFLGYISTNDCVRSIKKNMIRSHTKGVYKTDRDADLVRDNTEIEALAEKVAVKCRTKSYGFARLYPTVIRRYFGGMKRHLKSMASIIAPNGRYAIVVGDQASYFGIHIPTAKLLGKLAEECGFVIEQSFLWRERWATKTSKFMKEHALILRRSGT